MTLYHRRIVVTEAQIRDSFSNCQISYQEMIDSLEELGKRQKQKEQKERKG